MRPSPRLLPSVVLTVGLALLTACQAPKIDEPVPEVLAPYTAGPPRQPSPIASDAVLSPLEPWVWRYERVDDKHAGETLTYWIEKVEDPHAPYRRHVEPTKQVRHLAASKPGWVELAGVTDYDREVVTVFEDPLPVMRNDLKPGEPKRSTSKAVVHKLGDPDSVVQRGEATMTIVHEADQKIKTPAGQFQTRRIRLTFVSDFTMASVRSVSVIYYVEGLGIVAEKSTEKGRATIFPWTKEKAFILMEKPRPRREGEFSDESP